MPNERTFPSPRDRIVVTMSCGDLFLGVLAILFPPIAVWIKSGICSADSFINILLCVLGYLPGLIHAWYIIARNPERDYDYEAIPDSERQNQRVTYYYVRNEPNRRDYGTQPGQGQPRSTAGAPLPPPAGSKPNKASRTPQASAPPGAAGSSSHQQGSSGQQPVGPSVGAGGEEQGAPPSYSEVVRGDNKIQSQD